MNFGPTFPRARSGALWRLLSLASFGASLALVAARPAHGQPAPNIVLILVDDQGWNGTSVQMDPATPGSRSDFYETVNIEALAAAGMRFSSGYSAAPSCAPTRASLVTGKSPAQLQMTDLKDAQPGTQLFADGYVGLPLTPPIPVLFDPTQLTMPRLIKQANPAYQTAHYGKWHLNLPNTVTPLAAGFDVTADPALPSDEVDPWGVQQLAGLANTFMENSVANGNPFFVQISQRAVHLPIRSRQALRDKYAAKTPGVVHTGIEYAAMTEDLDNSVGTVLDKIEQLGIEDNTYVFYVSDNGAPLAYSSNTPLKVGKGAVTEGGVRVPFIVKGPGVAAGSVSEVPVMTTDLMTTFAAIAGYQGPVPQGVEGGNFLPVLQNGGQLPAGMANLERQFSERGEIYFHLPHNVGVGPFSRVKPSSAVRDGDFKLFVEYGENGGSDQIYLYNLRTNISESVNLAATMPQKTAELKGMLDNYLGQIDASFAYDVKTPIQLAWKAGQPGNDAAGWRSTIDVNYKGRETWALGGGAEKPSAVATTAFQQGLLGQAFGFDGGDVMRRRFFHVGDEGPRKNTTTPGTPDFDRSGSVEMWFRAGNLTANKVLFESGDGAKGMSLTLGDADANGSFNDLRFRVLGANGEALVTTVRIDNFANPVTDFVHVAAVFSDNDNDRYVEVYVNGASAGRMNGGTGSAHSLQWDGYDQAGLGRMAGVGVGANGGGGDLPFNGGFVGQMAAVNFWNHAVTGATLANSYNAMLDPVGFGVRSVAGGAAVPAARPTNVSLASAESNALQVMQERQHALAAALSVDAVVNSGGTMTSAGGPFAAGSLPSGTEFISYLLHFDPMGDSGGMKTAAGSIEFGNDILGLVLNAGTLGSTDSTLGSIGKYGLAADRGVQLAGSDFITISADRRTLSYSLTLAANDAAEFRVLTRAAIAGDYNGDGAVDGADLVVWKSSLGVNGLGDGDGDGDTDGADYVVWQRQLGSTSSSTIAIGAVPEPGACALAVLAAACLAGRGSSSRRRHAAA